MNVAEATGPSLMIAPRPAVDFEPSIYLSGVPWNLYVSLRDLGSNNAVRMSYDNGDLELMSPSGKHAKVSWLIGSMVNEWTMANEIEMSFGGDMTFKRHDISRGLEADQCYWLANETKVRGKDEIDLLIDPPPDLAIEVEVSRPLVPKLPIYQALGVPEVWHWRNDSLVVLTLDQAGSYIERPESLALPGFPFRMAEEVIKQRKSKSSTALRQQIRTAIAKLMRK